MITLYWILEYAKMFAGYMFLMFLWPSVVFRGVLRGKPKTFQFGFCVTVQVVLINSVVLMLGLCHLLNAWIIRVLFYGIFLWAAFRSFRVKEESRRSFKHLITGTYGRKMFVVNTFKKLKSDIGRAWKGFCAIVGPDWPEYGLLGIILVYGIIYFSYGAFQDYSYGFGDLYTHSAWIYGLVQGQIFSAGVYPEAMHCFIYCLHTLFGISIYSGLLFLAGIHVAVFLLSAYLLMKEIFRWRFTPMFVLAAFLTLDVVCIDEVYSMSRLQWSLPQEFGLYTPLLCAAFLVRYLRSERQIPREWLSISATFDRIVRRFKTLRVQEPEQEAGVRQMTESYWDENLFLFMMALSASLTIHFYPTIMAFFLCAAFVPVSVVHVFRKERFMPLVIVVVCGFMIAVIPMGGALVSGIQFQGSIGWAVNVMNGTDGESQGGQAGGDETDGVETGGGQAGSTGLGGGESGSAGTGSGGQPGSAGLGGGETGGAGTGSSSRADGAGTAGGGQPGSAGLGGGESGSAGTGSSSRADGAGTAGIQLAGEGISASGQNTESGAGAVGGQTSMGGQASTGNQAGAGGQASMGGQIVMESQTATGDQASMGGQIVMESQTATGGQAAMGNQAAAGNISPQRESVEEPLLAKIGKACLAKLQAVFYAGYVTLYRMERASWIVFFTFLAVILWAVSRLIIMLVRLVKRMRRSGRDTAVKSNYFDNYLSITLASVIFMMMYCAGSIGLPPLIAGSRLCSTEQLLILAMMAVPVDLLFTLAHFMIGEGILRAASLFCVAGIYAGTMLTGNYHGYLYYELTRYNAAVMTTRSIISSLPRNSYTIVSTTDEIYQMIQYGRHEELTNFLNKSQRGEYYLPTEYVFIYIEKKPIEYAQSHFFTGPEWLGHEKYADYYSSFVSQCPDITASEIVMGAPESGQRWFANSAWTYSNLAMRTMVESRAYAWCREFNEVYPRELHTYYEDDDFICYYFRQNTGKLYRLDVW